MDEIFEKYSNSVLKNLDKENINKIISFLKSQNCNFIEDILEDYLDLFTIDYGEFINKFHTLNEKYNKKYLELASADMNLLEEFYSVN